LVALAHLIRTSLRSVNWMLFVVFLLDWAKPMASGHTSEEILPVPTVQDQMMLESGKDLANRITQEISTVEWLGPLAPIALSPFFGMACLSGIATYGPDWLKERSSLFGDASPLNNPALFWTMLILTVVTSLPRLSKVSKPVALAAEKLEAYSVVVIVIAMRMFATGSEPASESAFVTSPEFQVAGLGSVSLDLALSIASAINILVINGVKLFCELVIWLTPIPTVDAIVEAVNKLACVGLMSLYCWSPLAATILNLLLLTVCAFVYLWTQRRIVYYLDLIIGPFCERWLPRFFGANADGETVFLADRWNGLPTLTKLRLKGSVGSGWTLTRRRWWGHSAYALPASEPQFKSGLLAKTIILIDNDDQPIELHQRQKTNAAELALA
jgi:hypothetical protein